MRGRVTGAGSVMFAESVSRALSGPLGRADAQDVVAAAARTAAATGTPFRDVVAADRRVTAHLDAVALQACFDPGAHVRAAADLVALTLSRRRPGGPMTTALAHDVRAGRRRTGAAPRQLPRHDPRHVGPAGTRRWPRGSGWCGTTTPATAPHRCRRPR